MTTTTKYRGGPLDGTDAVRIGAVWSPFRNELGEWRPAEMRRRLPPRFYEYLPAESIYVYRDRGGAA
jgi:hypothetical protein